MPVEIRELIIKANIGQEGSAETVAVNSNNNSVSNEEEMMKK